VRAVELLGELEVEPLRLADLASQLLLGLAELADLCVRDLEGLEQLLLGDLRGAGLHHRQAFLRADDDEVELGVLDLGKRRVDRELAVDQADADGADRALERERRDHQRRRGAVDAEDVVGGDEVGRERRADDLHLVPEALRPERPDRAVDHACGEDRLLGRAPLALEEAAGDLAGRVHALLDVDGEREEVRALPCLEATRGRGQDHRVSAAQDDGAVGLLGEMAGLHGDLTVSSSHRDRSLFWCDRAHVPPISCGRRRRRFEAVPPDGAPSNFHPVSRGSFGP